MALAITDDHRALAEVVSSFAADRQLLGDARRALDTDSPVLPGVWKQIADLGWLGLHLPESYGGSGFGLAELAVVADELGDAVSPGPFLATVTVSAIVARNGDAGQRERYLPALANGNTPAALGLGPGLSRDPGGQVSGTVPAVLGARWASVLLLRADSDLIVLDAAEPAVSNRRCRSSRPAASNRRSDWRTYAWPRSACRPRRPCPERPPSGTPSRCSGRWPRPRQPAVPVPPLDLARGYAKVREQFGRVIGSFQAVKHRLANRLVGAELAWDAARGRRRLTRRCCPLLALAARHSVTDLAGPAAVTGAEELVSFEYLFDRCLSIAGGTSEITRNVIPERILGLPRDPLVR
jgi:alkylation response protein AidB-like acyl-CoA dehydrogenase